MSEESSTPPSSNDEKRGQSPVSASPSSSGRITVVETAVGATFGMLGAFIGAFYLASLWKVTTIFPFVYPEHPNLEVFGFLSMFVLGASYTVIPRFKGRKLTSRNLAWASVVLFAAGNVIWLFTVESYIVYADLLVLLGSIIALFLLATTLRRPNGPLALAEPFMWLSAISLVIGAALKTYFDGLAPNSSWDSFPFLQIVLFAFPAMMIFGVEARTIHFRVVRMKKRAVRAATFLAGGFLIAAVLSAVFGENTAIGYALLVADSLLLCATCILFLTGIGAFIEHPEPGRIEKMNIRDKTRYLYFKKAVRIASYWLVFAAIFSVAFALGSSGTSSAWMFWIRDAFIHSMAVGFLASSIVAYSPILLPAVISGRAPYSGLTIIPLYIVTAGNVWRVGADVVQAVNGSGVNVLAGYSGIIVLLGMLWFVWMNHRL